MEIAMFVGAGLMIFAAGVFAGPTVRMWLAAETTKLVKDAEAVRDKALADVEQAKLDAMNDGKAFKAQMDAAIADAKNVAEIAVTEAKAEAERLKTTLETLTGKAVPAPSPTPVATGPALVPAPVVPIPAPAAGVDAAPPIPA